MADKMLTRVCTLGLSMLFEKQEANFDDGMRVLTFELERFGITEHGLKGLARRVEKMDLVAIPEDYEDMVVHDALTRGVFVVYCQDTACSAIIKELEDHPNVQRVVFNQVISRGNLKNVFREQLQDRYFCPCCDWEKESQGAPCENGECSMGLANFKQIQATNAALEEQLKQINSDAPRFRQILERVQSTPHFECPECEEGMYTMGDRDIDGDIDCPNCGYVYISPDDY